MWRYYIRIFDITKLKASNPIICGSFSAEVRFTKYNDNNNNTAVTFFWYHDMASLSFEAICVSSQRVGFHWKRRKCLSKSSCWRLLSRLGSDLKSASLSLSMSCSFSGCWPGRKRRGGGWGGMDAAETEKPLHHPVQVWMRGRRGPEPASRALRLPAAGSPGARCRAGCRPGPRSSVTPAGPGGRGRGGGPGRPHLPPEARTPAGPLPWRPRRPAQPLRQPGARGSAACRRRRRRPT